MSVNLKTASTDDLRWELRLVQRELSEAENAVAVLTSRMNELDEELYAREMAAEEEYQRQRDKAQSEDES